MAQRDLYDIFASFRKNSITFYQAYRPEIALPAVQNQTFAPPFSFQRMSWIKPSFLWLMHRSQWAQKKGQEHILAIELSRDHFETILDQAVLTEFVPSIHHSRDLWQDTFSQAKVHVQWDPERAIRGQALDHYSIQIGISRHLIHDFVHDWIVSIKDVTPLAKKAFKLSRSGKLKEAQRCLPHEKAYPLDRERFKHILPGG